MKYLASIILLLGFSAFAFSQQKTGVAAQNFTGTTIDSEDFELNKSKGNVVLLTFWSTRDMISTGEIPKLNKLADKYDGKNVKFVGLTMDNETLVNNFLKKNTFKFTIIPNSLGAVLIYSDRDSKGRLLMSFPAYYIVNQKGKVVLKTSGFSKTKKLDETISELLEAK